MFDAMTPTIGHQLRAWRQRRRMSQLDFALEAEISQRHLSFMESGRSTPSREMVLHLADRLDVPLRERNALLLAAGYAPAFIERGLDHPSMRHVRATIERLLGAHEPFPALAIDRRWNMVAANRMVALFVEGVSARLLEPPVNVLELSLDPQGLAPRIENLAEWRAHLLARLKRQYLQTGDPALGALYEKVRATQAEEGFPYDPDAIASELRLRTEKGVWSFLSTTMVFGSPLDVSLSELAIETFLPADAETADALRALHAFIA
jgi:transcriptional regulator with XRE-family HTH domain